MSNRKKIITLGVASATAIVAALFARDFIGTGQQPQQQVVVQKAESADVLVVTQDMRFGDVIQPAMLEWRSWPQDHLLPGMITRDGRPDAIDEIAGSRVRAPLVAGEPLMENKIVAREGGGLLSTLIPANMRAVSIRVSVETGVGGFVMPNDRVDVILTRSIPSAEGGEKKISDTVLENVRVLAVDRLYAGENTDQPGLEEMTTATLEVTPKQAQVLAQVQGMGELSLALRPLDERKGAKAEDIRPRLSPKFARNASGGVRLFRYGVPSIQITSN